MSTDGKESPSDPEHPPADEPDAGESVRSEPAASGATQTLQETASVSTAKMKQRWFGLRKDISAPMKIIAGFLAMAICTLLWWWTTQGAGEERILGHSQLPSIPETVEVVPEVFDSKSPERHILDNTIVSLERVIIGFAMAVFVGVPVGVAAGCFPLVRSFFAPLILFGRNIPIAALLPLVLAIFGTSETQKYMFIFIACVAFIIADTIDAVSDVAHRYVETALTLGASRLQIVFKVLVPLAMPTVFNSLRVLFGLAFGYIMLVEFIHDDEGAGGLGFLLNIARRLGKTEYTVIIILTIPLVAWMIDQMLYVAQCWLFRWKYGKVAQNSASFRLSQRIAGLFWRAETKSS